MPLRHYHPERYHELLDTKLAATLPAFLPYYQGKPEIIASASSHYRMRAEFRMWHDGDRVDFVMFRPDNPKIPHAIDNFPIAAEPISSLIPLLGAQLNANAVLKHRLFQVEFLTTGDADTLVTLIYHRRLDDDWRKAALTLQAQLGVHIIGRSRKQKVPLSREYVTETLVVQGRTFVFRQSEGVFTQPNRGVNQQMIEWVMTQIEPNPDDLLELYCGIGNFTLPLAQRFRRVLATEVSKQAVRLAQHNRETNKVENLSLVRMSSEEFTQALNQVRPFRRLASIPLQDFRLNTLLVDPPRSGLDPATLELAKQFECIIYISCNPTTLLQNLQVLHESHHVNSLAFFDQFPYTHHLECGVILQRRSTSLSAQRKTATQSERLPSPPAPGK
jgi:tRNA (uracil-5-)-methyltransferase